MLPDVPPSMELQEKCKIQEHTSTWVGSEDKTYFFLATENDGKQSRSGGNHSLLSPADSRIFERVLVKKKQSPVLTPHTPTAGSAALGSPLLLLKPPFFPLCPHQECETLGQGWSCLLKPNPRPCSGKKKALVWVILVANMVIPNIVPGPVILWDGKSPNGHQPFHGGEMKSEGKREPREGAWKTLRDYSHFAPS